MSASDIVIIGGGIIGLSAAFELSRAGQSVVVIDSGEHGQASSAAAGMLAPLGESRQSSPFVPLAIDALRLWPKFVDAVKDASGLPLAINGPGMLRIALNESEDEELRGIFRWQEELGLPLEMLDRDRLLDIEPGLTPAVVSGILTPMELYVEPQTILKALTAACLHQGVTILSDTTAIGFSVSGQSVVGVRTAERTFSASCHIVAGGAWSRTLLQELRFSLPVHPVRGQIAAFAKARPQPVSYTIYSHIGYLVPRSDGRIIAGATEERVGFDPRNTPEGIACLLDIAQTLSPLFTGRTDYTAWAGLRPISEDKMALIGPAPGWDGLWLATGHGRNGVLLAPYTASLIVDGLLNGKQVPSTFQPARFGKSK